MADSGWLATDSGEYEHFMGRWSRRLAKPFLEFVGIRPRDRVLDVGCGTGVLTAALAEVGAEAVGIDASEPYLDGARRHRPHPNITYERGDVRRMRFADGSFDGAICTLVLDTIPEVDQVVGEMRRVTRPGGVVASGVFDFWGGLSAFNLVWDTASVLDATFGALRDNLKAHPLVRPNGQAELWRRIGLADVVEVPDCHQLRLHLVRRLLVELHNRPGTGRSSPEGVAGRSARQHPAACARGVSWRSVGWAAVVRHHRARGTGRGTGAVVINLRRRSRGTWPSLPSRYPSARPSSW